MTKTEKYPVMTIVTGLLVIASIWNILASATRQSGVGLSNAVHNYEYATYLTAKNIKTASQYLVNQLAVDGGTLE